MKKRNSLLAIGVGIGIAIGYMVKKQVDHYERTSPEKALEVAKEKFKESGPISGSWIYMKPEVIHLGDLKYKAYRGAVSRLINGENKQYEFFADLTTGAIISTKEMTKK